MDFALDLERGVQVDVAGVGPEIGDLLGGDESLGRLRLGQGDPDGPPQLPPRLFREQRTKLGATVSPGER